MEVVSLSPLRTASMVWQPRRGAFVLTVVCKATFVLAPVAAELAPEQDHPNEEENHWNDDPARSVYSPCDLVPFKPRAEVTLVGHAFAPRGERVRSLVARMVVGEVDKSVEVFADRTVGADGTLREGPAFTRVPLRYERAAGGPDTTNPVGVRADARDAYGARSLPSLQRPGLSLGAADFIAPVGFGPIAAAWALRQEKLGVHAGRWTERALAAEPMPSPLDPQFFMAAPLDQQLPALRSNERIVLEHLHADYPRLVTSLPGIEPRAFVERPGSPAQELELTPDTLWIDTDRSRCTLTWRGQIEIEHPAAAGRVLVAMATPARRPSWSEVEAEARRGQGRAALRSNPIDLAELLPDDEGETPLPVIPGDRKDARTPKLGETMDMILPDDEVERNVAAAAAVAAERARKRAAEDTEMTRVGQSAPISAAPSGDASPAWLRTSGPPAPAVPRPSSRPSTAPPGPAAPYPPSAPPRLPVPLPPPVPQAPVAASTLPMVRFEPAPAPVQSFGTPWAPSAPVASTAPERPARPMLVAVGEEEGAIKLGAVAASNAAAASAAVLAPAAAEAPVASDPVQARPRELLDLLWFEPALPARLRATRPFRDLLSPKAGGSEWITGERPARDAQAEQAARDRRDVIRVLRGAEPLSAAQIDHDIDEAFDEDGAFSAPLAVAAGELNFRFDEREALKATVTAVSPLLGADKKLRDLVTEATEALKGEWPLPDDVAEGFTRRIELGFAQTARAVPAAYLQGSVDKLLLEGRQYRKKSVFSEPRIRAELACAGLTAPIPTYLPVALAMRLPLFIRFRTVMIVELRTQEDQHETHPEALLVLAVGRVLKERRSV